MGAQDGRLVPAGGAFVAADPPAGSLLTPERLSPEARLLARAGADFLRGEVIPAADRLQAHEPGLMASLLREAGALGLLGLEIPSEHGGLGLDAAASTAVSEALASEPSFSVSHSVHTGVAVLPLLWFGAPELRSRYLPRLASGALLGAFALSEAQAGSDAFAARTRASWSRHATAWALRGEKMWTTNAGFADLLTVFAVVDGAGLTAYLLDRAWTGVSVGREEAKAGLKGSSTCRVSFDDVVVPADHLLGEPGSGGPMALSVLNVGRFKIAASALGQSKNLLGAATRYAKQRHAFGRPIAEFGLIQQKLATMAARIFAAESILYRVAGLLSAALLSSTTASEYAIECALAKVACTETLDYVADECVQVHGGYGYSEEYPAARAWRDARVFRIFEGTNEVNRLAIAALLLRRVDAGRISAPGPPGLDADPTDAEGPLRATQARGIVLRCVAALRSAPVDVCQSQEARGALADMLIALFACQSAEARSAVLAGDAERGRMAACAADLTRIAAAASLRANSMEMLGLSGAAGTQTAAELAHVLRLHPSEAAGLRRTLALGVLEADGYIW